MVNAVEGMMVQIRRYSGFKALLVLGAALGFVLAIGVAVAIVAVGVFVVLAPFLLLAAVLSFFLPRARYRGRLAKASSPPEVIEGDFRVLQSPTRGRTSRPPWK